MGEKSDPSALTFAQRRSFFEMPSASEMATPLQPRRSATMVLPQTSTVVVPAVSAASSRSLEQRIPLAGTERHPSAVTKASISPVMPKLQSEHSSPVTKVLVSPLIHASIPPVIRSPLLLHQSSPQLAPQVRRLSATDGQLQATTLASPTIQGGAPAMVVRRSLVVPSPTLTSQKSPQLGAIGATSATTSPLQQILRSPQTLSSIVMTIEAEDDFFELPPPVVELEEGAPDDLTATEASKRWHEESEDGSDDDKFVANNANGSSSAQDVPMVRTPNGIHLVKAEKKYALDCAYSIWFQHAQHAKKKPKSEQQYEEGLNCIGTFSTVQDFWRYWNAIDLQKMPNFCSLSVFKHPIKPMWEDPHNKEGGQWVIRCVDRALIAEYFTKLALALIGCYFECHEDLCGVVLTMKPKFNSIGLWNCQVDPAAVEPALQEIRDLLNIQNGDKSATLEYKEHGGAISSNSVKLGEAVDKSSSSSLRLTDNLLTRRLVPSWSERPTEAATQSTNIVRTTLATTAVVAREALPQTTVTAAPAVSSSATTISGSTLKASAAPFTFTAPSTSVNHGYDGNAYMGTNDGYQYSQRTTNSQYDAYYAGGYGYYDSSDYNASGTYFLARGGESTGEDRLWT